MDQRREAFDILVADDDPVTRAQLRFLLLRNGYSVTVAANGEEAWALLQSRHFPICITDWSMPGLDGPDLCKLVRDRYANEYVYIILLTGMTEKEHIASGLEAGADDYVTKPFDSGELLARLRVGRRILTLQRDMRETEHKLRLMVNQDGLTTVMNRRALDESLQGEIRRLKRSTRPTTIAMLDIDFFKSVNDTHGHQAGDAVLKDVALRIKDVVRGDDLVGRYGGEEFLLILKGADAENGARVAERVRLAIQELPVEYAGVDIPVTISIGLCTAPSGYEGNVAPVVEAADAALYDAKRSGRNRVHASPVELKSKPAEETRATPSAENDSDPIITPAVG